MRQNRLGYTMAKTGGKRRKVEGRVRREERIQTVVEHIKISFPPKV